MDPSVQTQAVLGIGRGGLVLTISGAGCLAWGLSMTNAVTLTLVLFSVSSESFSWGIPFISSERAGLCAKSTPIVKKVVRRAELLKGQPHGFRFQACSWIEAADNPRPVHKLCHQTQHPK
jgi:hypothetical protein